MRHFLNALCLAAVLSAPLAIRADDEHHENRSDKRYYDAQRKDYHNWNDQEDRAYRSYLEERHREYRPYERLNKKEQRDYWDWRHSHQGGDHDRDDRR